VREIAFAHGGTVEARSDGDGWVRFDVTLPLAETGDGNPRRARSLSGNAAASVWSGSRGP
jgi:hypothetical protein